MELINSQVLKALGYTHIVQIWNDNIIKALPIEEAPTVDAVPRDIHDGVCSQIMWERGVAMSQLEEYGIPFGGIAPDVVKVVRCKNCTNWARNVGVSDSPNGICFYHDICTNGEDYCSYAEKETYK